MKSFHDDKTIKDKYLARVSAHMAADELIKGSYWANGKGCAVGCTIHGSNHSKYESELGIPQLLARLEDGIFEGLPNELAMTWPKRFLEAINVGSDLSNVWPQFAHWLLLDEKDGVIKYAKTEKQKETIQKIGDLYLAKSQGLAISLTDWSNARSDAYAAAAYAADAAAYAADAAAYAADAAADAADAAADAAAYAAAAAAAAYAADAAAAAAADAAYAAARSKIRIIQSEKLLELLRDAK